MRCFWFVLSCYSALCGIPAQTDRQPKQLFQSQTEQKTIQPTDCATVHGQILLVHAPSQLVCKLCSVHTSHSTDVLSVHWFLRSSNGIMQHFSNVQSRFLSLSLSFFGVLSLAASYLMGQAFGYEGRIREEMQETWRAKFVVLLGDEEGYMLAFIGWTDFSL